MIDENQDSFFRDKLFDLESPLNEKVSFEAVMEKRKKKRRVVFWWNPKVYVVAGLFVVGGLALFLSNPFDKTNKPLSTKELTTKATVVAAEKKTKVVSDQTISTLKDQDILSSQLSEKQFGLKSDEASLDLQKRSRKSLERGNNAAVVNSLRHNKSNRRGFSYQDQQQDITEAQIFETGKEYLNLDRSKSRQYKLGQQFETKSTAEETYTWNNVFDVIRSKRPNAFRFNFPEFNLASFNIDLDGKERPVKLKLRPSKWFAELSVITGSNNTINFEDNVPLSILGTQYMAQYQLLILKDLENGSMFGAGIQYSEWVGNGQWQLNKNEMVREIKNVKVLVSAPWEPKKYITIADTSFKAVNNVQVGNIEYRIDKISFPLAYRFYTQIAKTPIRLAVHLAPGYTTVNSGQYFNTTDYHMIEQTSHMTIDGRISLGPMIPISKKWTFVIEPSLIYQSYLSGNNTNVNGKFFTGLGIAILRQF
jgi:hypothetical protein